MAVVARQFGSLPSTRRAFSVISLGVVIALLYWARVFFITVFTAMAIAFILERFVELLMRLRFPRSFASFVVCSVALLAVYLMGLGAYTQIASLVVDYQQNYGQRVAQAIQNVRSGIEEMEKATYQLVVPAKQQEKQQQLAVSRQRRKKAAPEPTPPAPPPPVADRLPVTEFLFERLGSVYEILLMASFVPFLVYFMLSWRDHAHRSFLHFFQGEDRLVADKSLEKIGELVRGFVVGNFALGLVLAVVSSLIFWKMGLPYPLLTGPLSGFFSLIPYIGLPLALIPPLLVSVMVFEGVSSYVLLAATVMVLHILALNLLYPKLVGSRVHLNPLVVTVALMFWGFLWGAAGLVLAIPLTAGIKAVCDNVTDLRPYGKFLGD
jgi:predicted PurR-regulated permease PerM